MKSIRRNLLIWLLSGIAAAAVSEDVGTYLAARRAFDAVMDARLQDIAAALSDKALGAGEPRTERGAGNPAGPVIQLWDQAGKLVQSSRPAVDVPFIATPGLVTIPWRGDRWRVFVRSTRGYSIQVAESLSARDAASSRIALQIDEPLSITFLPALALLIWLVVGRNLRPLIDLARSLGRRAPSALQPLAEPQQILELHPIVESLNDLLSRIGRALEGERRFIDDAAHELQTPLTALRLQLQVFTRAQTQAQRTEALGRLERGIERATHVVSQLLTLARVEPEGSQAPLRMVALDEVVYEQVAEFTVIAQDRGVDLGTSGIEPATVPGNRESLAILLGNLIENAVRYTPRHGKVDVNLRHESSAAILEVIDSGPGIAPEERTRVFDRFYRGAGVEVGGSGLGLSIVKRIAGQHRARLSLADNPTGRGLRVEVRFPIDALPDASEVACGATIASD
ncbi:MAG TPA: ATP-binding protein [Steroidobacteraceae bacterium]|nr:ATP-binding protein [Steroidobacteraceae bacterium]